MGPALIAYGIMAHPSRAAFVPSLKLDAEITWDQKNNRWDTGRRAWLSLADRSEPWACVIQDDAILCRHFTTTLEKALSHRADVPVVLYAGNVNPYRRQFQTVPRETSWVVLDRIIWGPGIVMPTAIIPEVVAFCDRQGIPNYDLRLSKYFERRRIPVYYTWPSLVDHRDSPSLVKGRVGGRHAYRFATQPGTIDWSREPWLLTPQRKR